MNSTPLPFFAITASILLAAAGCGGNDTTSGGGSGGTTATGGSGGETTTTSGGTGGSGGSTGGATTGGGGAVDPCAGYVGQATPAELAVSPFFDAESEQLALEASGKIVAPQKIYDRVVFDLSAIRATTPAVQNIHAMPSWSMTDLFVGFDDVGYAAVQAGTYSDWNCANAWYGFQSADTSSPNVLVKFAHRMNPELLGQEYEMFPHISLAGANGLVGDGDDICVSIEGDKTYHYVFDHGEGDCQAGCITHTYWGFTTDGTSVTPLGTFGNQDPTPAWFSNLPACTKWL